MRREEPAPILARIRIVGVGGGGGNAINHMIENGVYGVDYIAVNTDATALAKSKAKTRICIGQSVTGRLGTGGNPAKGERAAIASARKLKAFIDGSDMLFITTCLGGGTGTGAAPIIAKIARKLGVFTVAIVTRPFLFEGGEHARIAEEGIEKLRSLVDTLVVVPNDRLLDIVDKRTSLPDAFCLVDDVLYRSVQAVSELVTVPGLINLDFADLRAVMSKEGATLIGVGTASGEARARLAAVQAMHSPLLGMTIEGARNILVNVIAGPDLFLEEIKRAMGIIKDAIHPDANFIFGTAIDNRQGDTLRVTIIATGIDAAAPSDCPLPVLSPPVERPEDITAIPPSRFPLPAVAEQPVYSIDEYSVPAFLRDR